MVDSRNMQGMQSIGYPVDLDEIKSAWEAFMDSGQVDLKVARKLDPAVLQSWRRCVSRLNPRAAPRLSPTRPTALASLLKAQAELITVSTPIMEDIHQFIEGSNCAIMLTDGSACVMVVVGDATAVDYVTNLGLGQGAYWSEGQKGANAFGLVLLNAMPEQVVGPEHYFQAYHQMVTSAAPIHDIRGRIIGIIGIIGPVQQANSHTLGLVMTAARAITNQLQANWSLQEANHRLSEVNTIMESISEGVVAWNNDWEIHHINTQAGNMLQIDPATAMGNPLDEVISIPALIFDAIETQQELHNVEVNFRVNGRSVRTLISLRSIFETATTPAGYLALLRPIEQVRQLVQQQTGTRAALTIDDVYGQSPAMRKVLRQARIAARGSAPVLLHGEGGVGKNHLAQAIHNDSPRAGKPYLAVNCRAIPHELMVGELLGQEKDVDSNGRPSKFELADGGTLLLDQVESLSLEMQAVLLQLIETGHIMRLGGIHPIPVDVRIIAATAVTLEELVTEGSFTPHLFYRFGVFNIYVPPLRQRPDDLPLLAERFLARITQRDSQARWIDDEAMEILRRYPWPGNVRELEGVLERAISHSYDDIIRTTDLPEIVRQGRVLTKTSPHPQPILSVAEAEREAIIRAGWACQGRINEMARYLRIGRTTLWRKMKRLNISSEQFRLS